jgi:hypothetical protein
VKFAPDKLYFGKQRAKINQAKPRQDKASQAKASQDKTKWYQVFFHNITRKYISVGFLS